MALRRGFKAEAERRSLKERSTLGLGKADRLDVFAFGSHLGIEFITLESLRARRPDDVEHLVSVDNECFSAALNIIGNLRFVVYNEHHPPGRQANSIAHEFAHYLLEHPACPVFDVLGNRIWDEDQEDEANYLAGALLAPREGLIPVMRRHGHDLDRAAAHFGISRELMSQRWHQTGSAKQDERMRGRYSSGRR
jgi:hypothetical protein